MKKYLLIITIIQIFIYGCSQNATNLESTSGDGVIAIEGLLNRFFLSNMDDILEDIGLEENIAIDSDEGIKILYDAAVNGNIYAQLWIGILSVGAKESEEVTESGLQWLELAASQEIGEVQCILALYYYDKTFSGFNIEKGAYWLEKAAINEIPEAEYFWGLFNYLGYSVPQNNDKGVEFIKKSYLTGYGPDLRSWKDYKLNSLVK